MDAEAGGPSDRWSSGEEIHSASGGVLEKRKKRGEIIIQREKERGGR